MTDPDNGNEISSMSRNGMDDIAEDRNFIGNVSDMESLRPAFEGIDIVVNLAASGGQGDPDGMNGSWETMLKYNIIGCYNVLEVAKPQERCSNR